MPGMSHPRIERVSARPGETESGPAPDSASLKPAGLVATHRLVLTSNWLPRIVTEATSMFGTLTVAGFVPDRYRQYRGAA